MSDFDRQKWNAKYSQGIEGWTTPSKVVTELTHFLPKSGRAIEIAGGVGRHAFWLAQQRLQVTLADISLVALTAARQRSRRLGLTIESLEVDLQEEDFPGDGWDVILSHHFLWRPLFDVFPNVLGPNGILIVVQPTVVNLERNERPPRPFLLEPGELPQLVAPLEVIHYEEEWNCEGRHEAVMVARQRGERDRHVADA